MILHCSRKLASKLSLVSEVPLEESSPLGSWHGHLFTLYRRQCVMFIHDATRFVLFLPGLRKDDLTVLGERGFRRSLLDTLAAIGLSDAELKKTELALGPVRFDAVTERSVLSSMTIVRQHLEAQLWEVRDVMDVDPIALSEELNRRPTTIYGKWLWPERVMRERIAAL